MRKITLDRGLAEDVGLFLASLAVGAVVFTLAHVLGLGDGWGDWRVAVVVVAAAGWTLLGARAQYLIDRARARRRLMAKARLEMERFLDAADCGHDDCGETGGSSGTLHECWRKRGRSWSYMKATGWVEGLRGTCDEVHGPAVEAELRRRQQGRAE